MQKGIGRKSTRAKLLIIISIIAVSISVIFGITLAHYRIQDLIADADHRLFDAAELNREVIGPAYHDRIFDSTSISSSEFAEIVVRNDNICKRIHLQYLWSVLVIGDRIVFTSATHSDIHNPASSCAAFFETHRDPAAFAAALSSQLKPAFSTFRNEWGKGRMVLVPYKDKFGRVYIFGASLQLTKFNTAVWETILSSTIVALLIFSCSFLVSIILSRKFAEPFVTLSRSASLLAKGELAHPLAVSQNEELGSISDSFNLMREEQVRQIKELQVREERYRKLFNSMSELFEVIELVYDENGKPVDYYFRLVNKAFEDFVKMPAQMIVGKRLKEIFGPVEDYWLETFDTVAKTGIPAFFENYGKAYDKYYNAHVWKAEGNLVAVLLTDITERKKIEIALKEQDRALRLFNFIVENGPLGIHLCKQDGIIQYANKAYCDMHGYTSEKILTMHIADLSPASITRESWETDWHSFLEVGNLHFEAVNRSAKGDDIPIEVVVKKIAFEEDVYACSFVRDIRKRKMLEAQLLDAGERERTEIGQELHDTVCQDLKYLEMKSSMLSQDLALIDNTHEAMARQLAKEINGVLNSTISIARSLIPAALDGATLGDTVTLLVDKLRGRFNGTISLFQDFAELSDILQDAHHWHGIIRESLTNAILHSKATAIDLSLVSVPGRLRYTIKDNGIGFNTRKPFAGLGLKTMRVRANALGALLEICSSGSGTAITLEKKWEL